MSDAKDKLAAQRADVESMPDADERKPVLKALLYNIRFADALQRKRERFERGRT